MRPTLPFFATALRAPWTCAACRIPPPQSGNAFKFKQFFSSTPLRRQQPTTTAPTRPNIRAQYKKKNTDLLYYTLSVGIVTLTLSYASVPLYRAICQRTGYGGTPITDQTRFTADKLVPVTNAKRIRVTFASSVSDVLEWKFTPQQREVRVLPGETALAFYTATNMSKDDIIGVATYSVTPGQVAPYFSKIQCFCFEEQKLNAGETVDMPVFFFIDPEFCEDPNMKGIDTVTLSYTFFKAKYDDNGSLRPLP
ncbi:cytochrome c oxidase assembly protein CtaG/Cox11-domain-containing protein [Sphaerosporella brunnea]|uniref:Cytochrome c oxidase assembly protein CtaG/Cox11-domain-containing protein n=1 Tax=Sphaerosporella brunnea TaxID=1250544 RepID=A0A5J5F2J1_9PEZI|nr:cytochrome c oxidase assembly protein CtaG/Cox11-domain-containing protein [Sphaerosporella brunnea]